MTTRAENSLIDAALRGWKSNIERAGNLFGTLSPEQLEEQVAPGTNRLIYLWGHLTAVNDGLLPLLGIGERLHPELDTMFISKPDRSVELTVTGQSLKSAVGEDQPEGLGRVCEILAVGLGGGGTPPFRRKSSNGNQTETIHRSLRPDSAHVISRRAGDAGAAEGVGRSLGCVPSVLRTTEGGSCSSAQDRK